MSIGGRLLKRVRIRSFTWIVVLAAVPALIAGCESVTDDSQTAEQATLTIGDPAPPLKLAKYLKGDPVDLSKGDKVHVIEFWATWCGPCRAGMPHISELQQHHSDTVAFVGVTREDEATVQGFLQSPSPDGRTWNEVIQYRIALDDNDQTNMNYMQAAGQDGIPCAFIVGREGIVEWIGHPARIDNTLQQVIDGTFDREAAKKEFLVNQRLQSLAGDLQQWVSQGKWDQAIAAINDLESELGATPMLAMTKLSMLEQAGRTQEAAEARKQVLELAKDDPNILDALAWQTALSGDKDQLDLAMQAAQRAAELTNQRDPSVLDTLARVYYEMGDLDQAIEWQKKAVEINGGQVKQIDEALEKYLAEKQGQSPEATSSEESAE